MTSYAALGVSLRSVAICLVDEDGTVQLEGTVPSEASRLAMSTPKSVQLLHCAKSKLVARLSARQKTVFSTPL